MKELARVCNDSLYHGSMDNFTITIGEVGDRFRFETISPRLAFKSPRPGRTTSLRCFSSVALLALGLCTGVSAFAAPAPTTFATLEAEAITAAPTHDTSSKTAMSRAPVGETLIYAFSLIGVKYRYGGNSAAKGFDCSGFVSHVFSETLSLPLPRSAIAMSKAGLQIDQSQLQPGDLVFYKTLKRAFSHVGLYIGDGRFVHAPSRGKTVEIVEMSDAYWRKRFNGARRVTPLVADVEPVISADAEPTLRMRQFVVGPQ